MNSQNLSINNLSFIESNNLNISHSYTWIKDKNIENCYRCNKKFGLIVRKHHCRSCGKIFCNECSNFWCKIPDCINKLKDETWNFNVLNYFNNNEQRVCYKCYKSIIDMQELFKLINIFDLLPLTIEDYIVISQVCKSWNKIAKYYFSYFKNMLFYLPMHTLNKKDINILYNNRWFFSGHSDWLVLLIRNKHRVNVKDTEVLTIIKGKKTMTCSHLLCSCVCKKKLELEHVIITIKDKIYNSNIIDYFIDILKESDTHYLILYLNVIVYNLRLYNNFKKTLNYFVDFFHEISIKDNKFANYYFWELTNNLQDKKYKIMYNDLRKRLIKALDTEKYNLFISSYDFTNNIFKILTESKTPKESMIEHFKNNNYFYDKNIYIPTNIEKKIIKIDIDTISCIDSQTKPLTIPFYDENNELYKIMIKNDDIRKEYIIMNIIKIIDVILKRDLKTDLNITTYNILPVYNNTGYIEFIKDAYTLYSIKEIHKFSIQNFIMEKNPTITTHEMRTNFTKSCASYCVISYLLGIGDRHLDNIMITDKGNIFNIDFGYILGDDPKLLAPEFRITYEMIDALGGVESKFYKEFRVLCLKSYNCLRNHTNLIYILLSQLKTINNTINDDFIKNHILERFIPGENAYNAELQFNYKLNINYKTYKGDIIDYFHKKAKSLSNSLSQPEEDSNTESIYESAKNVVNTTKNLSKNITNIIKKNFWK